jgi:EpsI family protein
VHRLIALLPAGILAVGCVLVLDARSQVAVPLAGSLPGVLPAVLGYEAKEQTISLQEQRVAGMTQYVARAFWRDSAIAFTTLVSYYDRQTQGRSIHSPRNCLPGAGWEIMSGDQQTIAVDGRTVTVNRYVLKNRSAMALAYYWYQGRGRVTANEYMVKWNLLRDAAIHGRTEEALVRVVVPVSGRGPDQVAGNTLLPEDRTAHQIVSQLVREVNGILPAL